MEFKKLAPNKILVAAVLVIFMMAVLWKLATKAESSTPEGDAVLPQISDVQPRQNIPVPALGNDRVPIKIANDGMDSFITKEDDAAIQEQLDHDREAQQQTRNLKTKLEQTNLELEEEKALAEINKLKEQNTGAYSDPEADSPQNFPEIKVDYIGGDDSNKEAILSIAGVSYQVKERSHPTDHIQVLAISSSGVTLHFTSPQKMTKTIEYKPE